MSQPLSKGGNLCLLMLLLTIITDCCINVMQYNLKTLQNRIRKQPAESEPRAPLVQWLSSGPTNASRRCGPSSGAPAISSCFLPSTGKEKQFVCSHTLKMNFPCSIKRYYPNISQFTFEFEGYFLPKWLIMGDRWL